MLYLPRLAHHMDYDMFVAAANSFPAMRCFPLVLVLVLVIQQRAHRLQTGFEVQTDLHSTFWRAAGDELYFLVVVGNILSMCSILLSSR